jgi:hypothetical protein
LPIPAWHDAFIVAPRMALIEHTDSRALLRQPAARRNFDPAFTEHRNFDPAFTGRRNFDPTFTERRIAWVSRRPV